MECDYQKIGCYTKISNSDHLQAHLSHSSPAHLKLLLSYLDSEIVKENKSLNQKVQQLTSSLKEHDSKFSEYDSKFREYDSKFRDYDSKFRDYDSKIVDLNRALQQQQLQPNVNSGSNASNSSLRESSTNSSLRESRDYRSASTPSPSPSPSSLSSSYNSSTNNERSSTRESSTKEKPVPVGSGKTSLQILTDSKSKSPAASTASPSLAFKPSTDLSGGVEKGVLWSYDAATDEWTRGAVTFKMDKSPFAEGGLRAAHHLELKSVIGPADSPPDPSVTGDKNIKAALPTGLNLFGDKYVSKVSKKPVPAERYFEDVKMQAICADLGAKFNQKGTPKPIQFLPAWVLEIPKSNLYCGLEPFIEGEFLKLQNNYGAVLSDRNTPQAFSHFTWEHTNHTLLVVDLQGVKDFYTDPQIHTKDGKGFGLGNLGMNGVDRFLKSHKCNAICQALNLPLLNVSTDQKKKASMMKGTMKVPFIEDQLGTEPCIKWEGSSSFNRGEFQCVQTLSGHDDRVMSLCVGGKYLFSGTYDGVIKAWNITTYALETTINAHRKSVESLCANSTHLFSGSADHSIKVWDLEKNLEVAAQLRDHVGEVNCICLSDKTLGLLASASFDKNIKIWNVRTFKCEQNLVGHTKAIKALAISGSILFSGSNDGSIMVWNLKYMSCLFTIDAHDAWVKSLVVKDRTLFSGGLDHLVKEWDIVTFNNTATLSEHNDDVLALLVTDKFLVSASQDRTIIVWDTNTKKVIATIKGHRSGGVQALATDGKHIFSGSDDYFVKVWKWVST